MVYFQVSDTAVFMFFALLLNGGELLKGRIFSLGENLFKGRLHFGIALSSRESNRKAKKYLFKNCKKIWM